MSGSVKPIPDGYPILNPYLIVKDAAAAIAFYERVFAARLRMRLNGPGGKVGHAEMAIGPGLVMLADEHPEMGARSPVTLGGSPVILHVYVENVDEVVQRAEQAGAKVIRPVENAFYGDRTGMIADPFGHVWSIATHVEDLAPDEIERRAAKHAS
jgi:PhnB protein